MGSPNPRVFPVRFTARGLTDALDSTDKFQGACVNLANLIFDQKNPELLVSRPGVGSGITDFTGFNTPGIVSVQVTISNVTYGMIGTAQFAGKDEPFAYDHATSSFLPITGVLAANCPTTQAASGPWTPPVMASVGVFLIVTHPGFPGGATKFGWFDLTVPGAPTWTAGDTSTNGLPSIPVSVANFFNRAYFACGNTTPYTDILTLTRTSASQALTLGDSSSITALSGLPVQTTSSGIIQALIAFKDFQTWQITGDTALSTLAQNYVSLSFGCSSPRSIAQSPQGLYFASKSGPMIIDQMALVRPVVNSAKDIEPDVQVAWENALVRSRIAGGYTGTIYRICMETILDGVNSTVDYWFDEHKRRWSGPHSFPYDCASQLENYFVLASNANPGKLFKSEISPSTTSSYLDNGTAMMSTIESSTFPKTQDMEMNQVVESTIELSSNGSPSSYAITGQDDLGNSLNSCQVSVLPTGTLWGVGVWGGFTWGSSLNKPTTYTVPWTAPLVFNKMAIYITVTAETSIAIGTFFARYKKVAFLNVR